MGIKKLSRLEIRKLVEVFIRDESGKLVKTSEEEALKYFQNMAAETNRKVAELDKNTAAWNLAEGGIRGSKKIKGRI